ncbi:MAG: hypothetical protein JW883_14320 [Deltaproteobacteria bacterium]|nr:hypothetical protein [Deltaproteobacteria bacterium]
MIEKHKKALTDLLNKINVTNIEQLASSKDEPDKFFQNVEDTYRQIQGCAASKLEELQIVSDMLVRYQVGNANESANSDSLTLTTDKAINKISNFAFFEMQEKLIPFDLEKGKCLFRQGRVEEALDTWEEVLKVNPDNEYIHSKLLKTMNGHHATEKRAEELHSKYQFKYIGSFGHNIARLPFAIIATGHEDILFVSDYFGDKICKFNTKGKYLGAFSLGLKTPMELFKDTEGNIWICDFGNSRLLAVDSNGNVIDKISLKDVLGETYGLIHPGFGCLKKDRFYLISMDSTRQQRRLLSFNRYNPHGSLDILPTDVFQVLSVFEFLDNQLYVCDLAQRDLFVYNAGQRSFNPIGCQGIPYPLRWFMGSSDGLFLSAGKHLLKVSLNGQKLFTANLTNIFGMHETIPLGLTVLREKRGQVLFVTDYSLACIHKFVI